MQQQRFNITYAPPVNQPKVVQPLVDDDDDIFNFLDGRPPIVRNYVPVQPRIMQRTNNNRRSSLRRSQHRSRGSSVDSLDALLESGGFSGLSSHDAGSVFDSFASSQVDDFVMPAAVLPATGQTHGVTDRELYEARITNMLDCYDPTKLNKVAQMLFQARDSVDLLLAEMVEKYGEEPHNGAYNPVSNPSVVTVRYFPVSGNALSINASSENHFEEMLLTRAAMLIPTSIQKILPVDINMTARQFLHRVCLKLNLQHKMHLNPADMCLKVEEAFINGRLSECLAVIPESFNFYLLARNVLLRGPLGTPLVVWLEPKAKVKDFTDAVAEQKLVASEAARVTFRGQLDTRPSIGLQKEMRRL